MCFLCNIFYLKTKGKWYHVWSKKTVQFVGINDTTWRLKWKVKQSCQHEAFGLHYPSVLASAAGLWELASIIIWSTMIPFPGLGQESPTPRSWTGAGQPPVRYQAPHHKGPFLFCQQGSEVHLCRHVQLSSPLHMAFPLCTHCKCFCFGHNGTSVR